MTNAFRIATLCRTLRMIVSVLLLAVPMFAMAQQRKPSKPRPQRPNMVAGLDPYREIVIPNNVNLVLKMGTTPSVEIQAERAIVKNLVCEVQNGVLYVSLAPCKIKQQWPHIKLIVSVDSTFREVTAALGGNISSDGLLKLRDLVVNAGTSTRTYLSLDVSGTVAIRTTASADVRLVGKAGHVSLDAKKNSTASLKAISADSFTILADGESKVVVGPSPSLSVEAHDFSKVFYDATYPLASQVCDTGAQLIVETREK